MSNLWTLMPAEESDGHPQAFGPATAGVVDDEQGGVIAYVHADNATRLLAALKPRTLWTLHIDDDDTFETTLHRSREEAVAARRAYVLDNGFELADHPDDKDFTSDGELATMITEHTVAPPNE